MNYCLTNMNLFANVFHKLILKQVFPAIFSRMSIPSIDHFLGVKELSITTRGMILLLKNQSLTRIPNVDLGCIVRFFLNLRLNLFMHVFNSNVYSFSISNTMQFSYLVYQATIKIQPFFKMVKL